MKTRACERILPLYEGTRYCECGTPLYDGRAKKCAACKAAIKKCTVKRKYTKHNYELQENILAVVNEMEETLRSYEALCKTLKEQIIALKCTTYHG